MSPWLSDLLLRTQTDERLAALARLGHQRAFETIVERYRLPLQAYAQRINSNRAEDLVQQTFLAALSALQAGTEVRHLRGWLYEILRNLAWRESGTWPAMAELDDSAPATESAATVAERRMLAVEALTQVSQLPERQHQALIQTAVQGRSRVEVAASMGVSEGSVRQLVHRARATVRSAVTAITPFPVIRWLAGGGGGLSETTIGAGTAASGGGLALKLGVGALVASGVLATGVTVSLIHGSARDSASDSARVAHAKADSDVANRAAGDRAGGTSARTILASQTGLPTPPGRAHSNTGASAGRSHSGARQPGGSVRQSGGQFGGTGGGSGSGSGSGGSRSPSSPGREPGDNHGGGSGQAGGSGSGSHGGAGGSDDGSSGSGTSGSGSHSGSSGGTQGGGSGSSTSGSDDGSSDDSASGPGSSGSSGSGSSGSSGSGSSGDGSSGPSGNGGDE